MINVRRFAEPCAAASMAAKSGFGGSWDTGTLIRTAIAIKRLEISAPANAVA
jgi:hypothetical protein